MPKISILSDPTGIPAIKISQLRGWQPDGFKMELMAREIDEKLSQSFPDIVTPNVRRSTAYVGIISGFEELIKNTIDAAVDIWTPDQSSDRRPNPSFEPEIILRVLSDGESVTVDFEDNCIGFPKSKVGKYKDTRDPDVTPATPSTKSTPSSTTREFPTLENDKNFSPKPANSSIESTVPSSGSKYIGGHGIGINRIAKVVQGNEIGALYRLNVESFDGHVTGALVSATSSVFPAAKYSFSDIGKLETDRGNALSPQELNELAPQVNGYQPPGPEIEPALEPETVKKLVGFSDQTKIIRDARPSQSAIIQGPSELAARLKAKRAAKKDGISTDSIPDQSLPSSLQEGTGNIQISQDGDELKGLSKSKARAKQLGLTLPAAKSQGSIVVPAAQTTTDSKKMSKSKALAKKLGLTLPGSEPAASDSDAKPPGSKSPR